jgi:starch synthase (maltosyl-transferring)
MLAKISAGSVIEAELLVGAELIGEVLDSDFRIPDDEVKILSGIKDLLSDSGKSKEERQAVISSGRLFNLMLKYPVKSNTYTYEKEFQISVERTKANFSSWYELFPRSLSQEPGKHGSFRDCIRHLDYVAEMGFDVLYLPPIHPIGEVNRKGKNNNTSSEPGDPGSPWAIGSRLGGHTSLHPELGSMDDFHELIRKAGEHGLEIAMDMAFQCAPDHPWIKEHPEWFKQRPDGSLQYAENPPKKYQDIYPLNFETDDWESLWKALRDVFRFWIKHEVKICRSYTETQEHYRVKPNHFFRVQ